MRKTRITLRLRRRMHWSSKLMFGTISDAILVCRMHEGCQEDAVRPDSPSRALAQSCHQVRGWEEVWDPK